MFHAFQSISIVGAKMLALPTSLTGYLHIQVWADPIIDQLGFDPRSTYVERFWLGALGPSTTWLLRRIASELDECPDGFDLPLLETARALGLGGEGKNSPFIRALTRCCKFEMARPLGDEVLSVRRKLPPLNRRQLNRLSPEAQAEHDQWVGGRPPEGAIEERRVRHLAMSLVQLGEDLEGTERQLLAWKFNPVLIRPAAVWACEQHHLRLAAKRLVTQEQAAREHEGQASSPSSSSMASSSALTVT